VLFVVVVVQVVSNTIGIWYKIIQAFSISLLWFISTPLAPSQNKYIDTVINSVLPYSICTTLVFTFIFTNITNPSTRITMPGIYGEPESHREVADLQQQIPTPHGGTAIESSGFKLADACRLSHQERVKMGDLREKAEVIVVLGAQFGNEGKGRIVAELSEDADICCRFNGGANCEGGDII
jgi:hypothetical protein